MPRRPDLDQLASFLAVAEEMNFRRAAQRLSIDQSALSRRIKALEERVGFALFLRNTHGVRMTEAGADFHEANLDLLGRLDAATDRARRVAQGASGRLRIGYMTFAAADLLPRAVRAFRAAHPRVAIELDYQPTLSQKLSLARGEIDLGLMLGPLEHADFATLALSAEPLAAVMAETDPLAARPALTLAELAAAPMILGHPASWDFFRARLDEIFALGGQRPKVAFEAPDLTGILGLVRAGLGVTVLPGGLRPFCPQGVAMRPLTDPEARIATLAAWRRPAGGQLAAFLPFLRRAAARLTERG